MPASSVHGKWQPGWDALMLCAACLYARMAADGRSCSASELAVQVWLPLALVTLILRWRCFLVVSCSVPVIVVRRATWYGGRAPDVSAAVCTAALDSPDASEELAATTDSEPMDSGSAV